MEVLSKIRRLHEKSGLSIRDFAEKSGISQTTIRSLYSRENTPTLPTLIALCSGLDMTLNQFFLESYVPPNLSDDQIELLDYWASLTDEQRKAFLALLSVI